MKIFYGVQGTGNGHISRARAINKHLRANSNIEVTYLFSGRDKNAYFDMEEFDDWDCKSGLTFVTERGKVNIVKTMLQNKIRTFLSYVKNLDLSGYDLVLCDFEPITAWAARRQKVPCIGLGHQAAFNFDIPVEGDSFITRNIMRWFAPTALQLGLHWHHFGHPILPPIVDLGDHKPVITKNKILVYLNFESPNDVIPLLKAHPNKTFFYYGEFDQPQRIDNIELRPLSKDGFKKDLADCEGVISNAGFELTSEALQLGKKILVKPLSGQMEQLSNALALRQLGLGSSMSQLDSAAIAHWLNQDDFSSAQYPDVAKAIVDWLLNGHHNDIPSLARRLWEQSTVPKYQS